MPTPERSVKEIVEEVMVVMKRNCGNLEITNKEHVDGDLKPLEDHLIQTIKAERRKRDEMVEKINSINTREMNVGENRSKYLAFNRGENHMKVKILQALTHPNNPK